MRASTASRNFSITRNSHSRHRVVNVGTPNGAVTSYLPAITIAGLTPQMGPVPAVGQHTDAILSELRERARL